MILFLEKFRYVTRYGLSVFLAAVSCFSSFAEIDCHAGVPYLRDGQWYVTVVCNGDFFSSAEVPVQDPSSGGGGGSCTNCTAMSPEECEYHKRRILWWLDYLQPRVLEEKAKILREVDDLTSGVDSLLSTVLNRVARLRDEGDQFVYYPNSSDVPGSSTSDKNDFLLNGPTSPYIFTGAASGSILSFYTRGGNNSIYNYYNDTVKGLMVSIEEYAMEAKNAIAGYRIDTSGLDEISDDMVSLRTYVSDQVVCTACQGSSGGGGGGGGSSDGCPCSEVLTHIMNIVKAMSNDVGVIRQKIEKWDKYFETFKYQMRVITDAVAPIGTNFVAAVGYRDLDGQSFSWNSYNRRLWRDNSQMPFDFGEFSKLSWFSRVEYSLLHMMGVFDSTNEVAEIKNAKDRADEAVDGHALEQSDITGSLDSLSGSSFDSIRDSFMSMFQQFSFFGSGRSSIQDVVVVRGDLSVFIDGLGDVSVQAFAGNQQLVKLSDRLVFLIRCAFQLIYLAVFCLLAYILVVFLYGRIAQLVMWICSFYASVFGS